jgi:hypothetical protein
MRLPCFYFELVGKTLFLGYHALLLFTRKMQEINRTKNAAFPALVQICDISKRHPSPCGCRRSRAPAFYVSCPVFEVKRAEDTPARHYN